MILLLVETFDVMAFGGKNCSIDFCSGIMIDKDEGMSLKLM